MQVDGSGNAEQNNVSSFRINDSILQQVLYMSSNIEIDTDLQRNKKSAIHVRAAWMPAVGCCQ
jgi:hypothetical protein